MFITALTLIACSSVKIIEADQQFYLTRSSLLLYLDKIHDQNEPNKLIQTCNERKYAFTVYYRMIYFRFCGDGNFNEFEHFCDNVELYHSHSSSTDVVKAIINTASEKELFGPGTLSDHLWEAKLTCQSVRSYFDDKYELSNKSKTINGTQQPKYTERLIDAVPFCLPVSCGFTADAYYNQTPRPSLNDCLPPSYQTVLTIGYCFDSLIILGVFLASLLILITTPKTKIAATPHGCVEKLMFALPRKTGIY